MKVIVIEDGYSITTVDDSGKGCTGCVFETLEIQNDVPTFMCVMDSRGKLPCVNTIYALVQDAILYID